MAIRKIPLSSSQKKKILEDAKEIRSALKAEADRYAAAAKKQTGRTRDFYQRAKELVRQEMGEYTQKAVRARMGSDNDLTSEMVFESAFIQGMKGGSTATNVARRVLTTYSDIKGRKVTSSSQAGARFYGGLIDVWYDPSADAAAQSADYAARDKRIMKAFGKRNLLQVVEMLEDRLGIDLLNMLEDPAKYQEAIEAIQAYVAENRRNLGLS